MIERDAEVVEWHKGSETPDKLGLPLPCRATIIINTYIQGHVMRSSTPAVYEKHKRCINGKNKTVKEWVIPDLRYSEKEYVLTEDQKVENWYIVLKRKEGG